MVVVENADPPSEFAPLPDLGRPVPMNTTDRRSSHDSLLPGEPGRSVPRDLTGVTLDDFRVEKVLGGGGMGEVYLATQISLNRSVAIKVLKSDFAVQPDLSRPPEDGSDRRRQAQSREYRARVYTWGASTMSISSQWNMFRERT